MPLSVRQNDPLLVDFVSVNDTSITPSWTYDTTSNKRMSTITIDRCDEITSVSNSLHVLNPTTIVSQQDPYALQFVNSSSPRQYVLTGNGETNISVPVTTTTGPIPSWATQISGTLSQGGIDYTGTYDPTTQTIEFTQIPIWFVYDFKADYGTSGVDCNPLHLSINTTDISVDEHVLAEPSIYPNPASSEIRITLPEHYRQWAEYQILDMSGRMITAGHLQVGEQTLDISGLSSGLHIMRMMTPDQQYISTHKLIKQ